MNTYQIDTLHISDDVSEAVEEAEEKFEVIQEKHPIIQNIIQVASDIYQHLGSGMSECVYHRAMEVGFRETLHISYESEKLILLSYLGHNIGNMRSDLVVPVDPEDCETQYIIVELKAIGQSLGPSQCQQVRAYLTNHPNCCAGRLINFPQPSNTKDAPSEIVYQVIPPPTNF